MTSSHRAPSPGRPLFQLSFSAPAHKPCLAARSPPSAALVLCVNCRGPTGGGGHARLASGSGTVRVSSGWRLNLSESAEPASPSAALLPTLPGWRENGMSEVQKLRLTLASLGITQGSCWMESPMPPSQGWGPAILHPQLAPG